MQASDVQFVNLNFIHIFLHLMAFALIKQDTHNVKSLSFHPSGEYLLAGNLTHQEKSTNFHSLTLTCN